MKEATRQKTGGWGRPITRADLRDGRTILSLWLIAVARGWIQETDHWRIQFVGLALACSRKLNPGGYLTCCVKKKDFKLATNEDVDEARQIVKRMIRLEPEQRTSNVARDDEIDFVARREEMSRRLADRAREEAACPSS